MAKRTKAEDAAGSTDDDELTSDSSATDAAGAEPQASSTVSAMAGSAKQAAAQAKETVSRVIDQAQDEATSRADQQRHTLASGFQTVAHAFRSMGDNLRSEEQGPVAQYAAEMGHAIAEQVDRVANYLHGRELRHIVNDAEDLARRSPTVFLGGAFVLGLITSRFLKSSRPIPDALATMPDPRRALPPASTGGQAGTRRRGRSVPRGDTDLGTGL
ncbi:MAG: hypothetical protein JOZ62_02985 [Acidobacteriaceae bacterium]|nr:hypothetical protein [Acidobacteriaceae bacterium]